MLSFGVERLYRAYGLVFRVYIGVMQGYVRLRGEGRNGKSKGTESDEVNGRYDYMGVIWGII